jgi:hypothetical protein
MELLKKKKKPRRRRRSAIPGDNSTGKPATYIILFKCIHLILNACFRIFCGCLALEQEFINKHNKLLALAI